MKTNKLRTLKGERAMPTYICTVAEGRISQNQKAAIALQITRIHSEVTGAPSYFAQVMFHEIKPGNHFMGGDPLSHDTLFVHGHIRAGRTPENKRALIERLAAALAKAVGLPASGVWIYIAELPARQMVEFGQILPEPGSEDAWTKALPAEARDFMQRIGRQ
jgi:phenylpyruvate tautomerase PptA (4-oxalocrotonate tautomerase family)